MKIKFINRIFYGLFLGVFLFFSYNFFKIIFEERKIEKQEVIKSLYKNKEKIDLTFKYSIWNEAKSVNYNEILENYLFYKREIILRESTWIFKIPYKEKSFMETGKNAAIILRHFKKDDKQKIQNLINGKIKTVSEIEEYLLENNIKNYKIIFQNSGNNYMTIFSNWEIAMILEKYYKESFKYPIIKNNDMIFYKKEDNNIYMLKIQNYKYVFKSLLQSKLSKNYEYFFIVTPSTRYLYHPKDELMNTDIFLEAKIDEDKALEKKANELYQEDFFEDYSNLKNNKMTSQESIMGYVKLSQMPFYLGIISIKEGLMLESSSKLNILLTENILIFSILNFLYLIFNIKRISTLKLCFISFLQFVALNIFVVMLNSYSAKKQIKEYTAINNEIEVGKYLKRNKLLKDFEIKLEVDSIEYQGTNNVKLTGTAEYPNKPENNFFFPDAVEYEERIISMDKDKIVKQFFLTLREKFEYDKYPLDSNIIWLRIRNRADNNKIITPDFEKYTGVMLVSSKIGINKNIVLNGWDIAGTFFTFNKVSEKRHELLFNICMKREILNPFISTLLPITIILFIIFGILILIEKDKSESRIEFILGSVSGLFFTIIISQNNLREQINTNELLYLDYYYFLIYIILSVIILLSFTHKYKKITYEKIYIFKKLFWFLIFFIILIITYFIFKN